MKKHFISDDGKPFKISYIFLSVFLILVYIFLSKTWLDSVTMFGFDWALFLYFLPLFAFGFYICIYNSISLIASELTKLIKKRQ